MFDQIKDMYNLRKQAQEMQKQMGNERITGFSADKSFTFVINGNQEMLEVNIAPDANMSPEQVAKNIKQAYNDAQDKVKNLMMTKFKGMM